MALHESRLEIRSIVAILVGFWDSFLVGIVVRREKWTSLSLRRFMEENERSRCLQYCSMRFLLVICSSVSGGFFFPWRFQMIQHLYSRELQLLVVESICILSWYFLLEKHKGKRGKLRVFWSAFLLKLDEHYWNFVCRAKWIRADIAE